LKILRLSKHLDQVDLSKTHKSLKKVIFPNVPEGYSNASLDVLMYYPVSVNKICFNPQDRLNSVGLDNITELTLHFKELEAIEEPFVPIEMKNLSRLAIILRDFEDDFEDNDLYFESTIEPLFQGIGFSSNLKEVHLEAKGDYQIFGDLILGYLSQITRLEIVGIDQLDFQAYLEDLLWIPNLKNLKTLVLSDLDIYTKSDDEGKVPFYKTPMTNVKRLEFCGCSTHKISTFLIKLPEIFPALYTLKITDGNEWSWNISVLESILNALGSIKNLIIPRMRCELEIPIGCDKPMSKVQC
jgi:hypothetical protein